MKKIFILIGFILCVESVNALSTNNYIVMSTDNNQVIEGSNIHSKKLIASTSKIMTAIIAIEKSNLNKIVTIDKSILKAVGSSIYVEVGEKLTLEDLIYGMMLRSGNDAATMIAVDIAGDMASFANIMNEYSQRLGMNDTVFYNSHGLEENDGTGNVSSAYDMALLTSYAMKNKTFKKIFSTKSYQCQSDKKHYEWQSKNKLLKEDYITGGKTGYTKKAKRTLVTTGIINNINLVVVTLNDPNDWEDHKTLYQKVNKNYQNTKILDHHNFKLLEDSIYLEDKLYIKNDYHYILKNDELDSIKITYNLYNDKHYRDGDNVGLINVYKDDTIIHTENIYVQKNKKSSIKKFWQKIIKIFNH